MVVDKFRARHLARLEMVAQGLSVGQIAKAEGVHTTTVTHWAQRHGVTIGRGPGRAHVAWQTCMDAGMSAVEAALHLGKTNEAARFFARRTKQKWAVKPARDELLLAASQMPDAEQSDFVTLVSKGGYSWLQAREILARPKVKVPLMVPRTMAAQIRAEGRL